MNAVKAWSFSAWAAYDNCPLAYKLEKIDKVAKITSPAMERGNMIHKELADYIVGHGGDALPSILHPKIQYAYREMRNAPEEMKLVEQQWGFTKQWMPTGWFAGNTWLRAVLDVALMYEDMTGEAVDHKTGRRYEDNDDQMELFGASFLCKYPPATEVTTRLIYVESGDEVLRSYKQEQVPAIIAKWNKRVEPMFTDTVFAPKRNRRCGKCIFNADNGGQCRFR